MRNLAPVDLPGMHSDFSIYFGELMAAKEPSMHLPKSSWAPRMHFLMARDLAWRMAKWIATRSKHATGSSVGRWSVCLAMTTMMSLLLLLLLFLDIFDVVQCIMGKGHHYFHDVSTWLTREAGRNTRLPLTDRNDLEGDW